MYDPVTLDQLRALVAVADEGSFSAAARKLKRVQSAVSTSMANLEAQLGLPVWDRSTKVARLTEQGQALLRSARRVLGEVDGLRRVAAGMVRGLEPAVSLCFDAIFPLGSLIDLCAAFAAAFPEVDLRVDTQVMSAVTARVLDGRATLGVVSPGGIVPGLQRRVLSAVRMLPVVSPSHPLAALPGKIAEEHFADAVQIVLSERSDGGVEDRGVLSPRTWRVSDLHTKHMMLRAGLGWGNLPEHLAQGDLRAGRLVRIAPRAWGEDEHTLYLSAICRSDMTFGPAHRWIVARLEELPTRGADPAAGARPRRRAARAKRRRAR
ncbi:MAG: LysR family transcriptional regulator [Labilithrix sp.]|nr:LysR family transcriptional regulator [Labilithrix sp.]